ncbi:MAG: hypothetical protein UU40_C0004G0030 [Candidatus Uhrbacteria bacterium GW2011_GWD2_41_121]|uniref:Glycerophosphoryl diester phosphodiesterase membrane domain-containing protein n=1 Tax=Candidatus Uhrbacteria bacterium GW2011_GWC1_41_20 TaxID=1618983 RepID=A0A0G0VFE0_9BACT|nr:MAG: hypothetical protein UT52_C0006G0030 [Candidatus Uhrbacteria bacterium GW2011_GWE1_39_46]KKR64240.1 MAG: hypothetical protein UU04_C0004G0030 [Candidatus Uhrbacteria bacterium GW2011_GWC2_40_450]KKR90373.1 MAG: hypothetical protein UU40_C0004G0030 [Candidatus Uhrbacteria bacterium GW2011_GWD2_41_121]KKR96276.1 MAG: hypothetical protein UU46_C0005G0030 [Candidatus Uhrbacteria bacterium GW2011_GWD1_41_16]KKR99649.1 MAG: hypothetical protein UU50_C0004G0030 [Candidatus Uhrbacteria bacteriu
MTVSSKPAKEMQNILTLVQQTWNTYKAHISTFVGYSAWMLVPMIVKMLCVLTFGPINSSIFNIALVILELIVTGWVMISLIQSSAFVIENKKVDTRIISAKSWSCIAPLLLLLLLSLIMTSVGFVLLVIPGIVISVYLTFSTVILVLENASVVESIKKSFALITGRFWQIFVRLYISTIILLVPYMAAYIIIVLLLALLGGFDITALFLSPSTLMEQILLAVIDVIFLPLFPLFSVILYKTAKETR